MQIKMFSERNMIYSVRCYIIIFKNIFAQIGLFQIKKQGAKKRFFFSYIYKEKYEDIFYFMRVNNARYTSV